MNPTQIVDEISIKIKDMVSSSPLSDLERNINALLQGAFTKLELVSREEFDVQADVLRSTRDKLANLEKSITELENQLKNLQEVLQNNNK